MSDEPKKSASIAERFKAQQRQQQAATEGNVVPEAEVVELRPATAEPAPAAKPSKPWIAELQTNNWDRWLAAAVTIVRSGRASITEIAGEFDLEEEDLQAIRDGWANAMPAPKPDPDPEPAAPKEEPKPRSEFKIKVDVEDPLEVAREFLASRYSHGPRAVATLRFWRGAFYHWTGSHYAELDGDDLNAELWDFLSKINGGKLKPQQSDVNGLRDAIKAKVQLKAEVDVGTWLDSRSEAPWGEAGIIVCKNGVVRLSDGRKWENDPRLFVTNAIETEYRAEAKAPLWEKFLGELWPGDAGAKSRGVLQEWFGLLLTDETRYQKGLMIIGPARSGKGTIARTIRNLLGSTNYCGPSLTQLGKDFGLAPLIGKKIAVIPDARTDSRTNRTAVTERLLSIIGEDPQDINRKNKEFWEGILRVRMMILSNELPDFKDDTGVIATRWIILQMHRSFLGHEDMDLEAKLREELPGILNWALAGLARLIARGRFEAPRSDLNDELAGLASSIKAFVADRCEFGVAYSVKIDSLFETYRAWAAAAGVPYLDRLTKSHFSGKLRGAFPGKIGDERPGTGVDPERKRLYLGIRLRPQKPLSILDRMI